MFRPSSVCLLDIDNDNDLDMYLVNQRGTNYLKLNDGSGKFSPAEYLVSPDPGIRNAHAAFADINDDGWLDLYESREYSHNMIYLNRGNLTFTAYKPYTDIADDISQTYATLWADFNGDNLIDLFEISPSTLNNIIISNKLKILINQADSFQIFKFGKNAAFYGGAMGDIRKDGSLCIFLANYGYPNFLFSLTKEIQPVLCNSIDFPGKPQLQIFRKSEGAVFFDIDNDGDLDLYVCNEDSVNELYLWKNNRFIEDAERRGLDDKLDSEGFLIADFDQDMDWDIYILHTYQPNTLLLNNGHGYFFEQTAGSGFEDPGGWRGAACGATRCR